MRCFSWLGCLGFLCAVPASAGAQWLDDFDPYAPSGLAAQSLWDEWSGSSGVDAMVDNSRSFTASNSVLIVKDNDVVYDFVNLAGGRPTSGVWTASIKTYVPFLATGIGWYIMLNQYPTSPNWSVQTSFDASNGVVMDGSSSLKLKYNRWVSLVVSIDLDNDRYDSWYDNQPLVVNGSWTGGSGSKVIAVVDLYGDSGGLSGMYFDQARLEKTSGGPLLLNSTPNPVNSGSTLNVFSSSPLLGNGDPGFLFTWTVNGSTLILPLFPATYDTKGEWKLPATVPPGLSGLEVGLKMFALPAGGKILTSNEDLILFL